MSSREDVREQHRILVGEGFGQRVHGQIGERHADVLSLGPVDQTAKGPAAPTPALPVHRLAAMEAAAAGGGAGNEDPVARPYGARVRAGLDDRIRHVLPGGRAGALEDVALHGDPSPPRCGSSPMPQASPGYGPPTWAGWPLVPCRGSSRRVVLRQDLPAGSMGRPALLANRCGEVVSERGRDPRRRRTGRTVRRTGVPFEGVTGRIGCFLPCPGTVPAARATPAVSPFHRDFAAPCRRRASALARPCWSDRYGGLRPGCRRRCP